MILKHNFKQSLLFAIFFFLIIFIQNSKAENFKKISLSNEEKEASMDLKASRIKVTQKSKYLDISITTEDGKTYRSKAVLNSHIIVYNNDNIFFIRYNKKNTEIVQVDSATQEEKIIKVYDKKYFPTDEYNLSLWLHQADKNYLYYSLIDLNFKNKDLFNSFHMYRINLDSHNIDLIAKNVGRSIFSKDRMIYTESANDLGPMPLYSVKLSGKASKKLNTRVIDFEIINNKLYYVGTNTKNDTEKYYVFSANTDFSNIKKLSNVIKTKPFENLTIGKITDKKVYYEAFDYSSSESCNYCFIIDLKTKKVKRIEKNLWEVIK